MINKEVGVMLYVDDVAAEQKFWPISPAFYLKAKSCLCCMQKSLN